MKTYRQFIESVEDTGYLSEMQFPNPFAGMVRDVKTAADVFQYATGIKKPPVNIPAVKDLLLKGSQVPNFSNIRFKIGTPQPTASVAPKPTPKAGGGPIATVVTALTNLQGSTPQSGPAYERAKAEREKKIQAMWGDAMNRTPSRFDKAGPDVPETPAASPEQGVGTKPRVAAPYTPPRPAAEPTVEPVKAKVEPKVTIPRADNPRVDPFAPVTRQNLEKPVPRLTGRITTAQSGDNIGSSKSKISTYVDPNASEKQKKTHIGRHLTLAQHRKAVADRKAEEAKRGK